MRGWEKLRIITRKWRFFQETQVVNISDLCRVDFGTYTVHISELWKDLKQKGKNVIRIEFLENKSMKIEISNDGLVDGFIIKIKNQKYATSKENLYTKLKEIVDMEAKV